MPPGKLQRPHALEEANWKLKIPKLIASRRPPQFATKALNAHVLCTLWVRSVNIKRDGVESNFEVPKEPADYKARSFPTPTNIIELKFLRA
jgi:hypothetical protein